MNTITEALKATVREGYQVLLRAEAELNLPEEREVICGYYRILAQKCMSWATEIHGERIRRDFLAIEDLHDRALWRAQKYRLLERVIWIGEHHIAILCESYLLGQQGNMQNSYHRLSHVWDLNEQSILPIPQILELFGCGITLRDLPFTPDGVYPDGNELIFYKNPTADTPLAQSKSPIVKNNDEENAQ